MSAIVQRLLNFVLMKLSSGPVLYAAGAPIMLFGWVSAAAWPVTDLVGAPDHRLSTGDDRVPVGDPGGVVLDSQIPPNDTRLARAAPTGH